MGTGDNGKQLGHARQRRATMCHAVIHRFGDSFLQPHSRSARLYLLRVQKDDTSIFQRAPNSFDICGGAGRRSALAFHAPYCWHGQLSLLSELRLGPVQQRSGSAYLSSSQFWHFAFAIMLAKNDHAAIVRDSKRLIRTRKANQCLDAHPWRRTRTRVPTAPLAEHYSAERQRRRCSWKGRRQMPIDQSSRARTGSLCAHNTSVWLVGGRGWKPSLRANTTI